MRQIGKVNNITREQEFEWRILNFSSLPAKKNYFYASPTFFFAGESWYLTILPNGGKETKSVGYIDMFLHRESPGRPISLEFTLILKTMNKEIYQEKDFSFVFEDTFDNWGDIKLLERSEFLERKSELHMPDVLIVICRMKYGENTDKTSDNATAKCSNCEKTSEEAIKCPMCCNDIKLKDWNDHECQKSSTEGDNATAKCSNCEKTSEKAIKCPMCRNDFKLKDWNDHECQKSSTEGDNAAAKCSNCEKSTDASNFPLQETRNSEEAIPCPVCRNDIKLKDWHNHECQKSFDKLSQDLEEMMLNGENKDTIVKVKGEEFRLHRDILAARNPYFHSMFINDMKEKNTGFVSIHDCEPDIFRIFVQFLYTGKVDKLSSENVCEVYETTDKYQEDQLKKDCLDFMMTKISEDSFCDYITLSLKYGEKQLFEKCVEFLLSKPKDIVRSVKWQIFAKEYPTQANELFIKTLDHFVK